MKNNKDTYHRLIAIWAVNEGVLGGILHGFQLPITGLFVGGIAIILIAMIGMEQPQRGAILQATLVVCVFKMLLSPQSPLPAYFAVLFQGVTGELLLRNKSGALRKIAVIIFATLALTESAVQRIVSATLVYGKDFWTALDEFIASIAGKDHTQHYSYTIVEGYILLHIVAGIAIGIFILHIPGKLRIWRDEMRRIPLTETEPALQKQKRKKILRNGFMLVWIILLLVYIQSSIPVGKPLMHPGTIPALLLRSALILTVWYVIIAPLIMRWFKKWLSRQEQRLGQTIRAVEAQLPLAKQIVLSAQQRAAPFKGGRKWSIWIRSIISAGLSDHDSPQLMLLTGPKHSGKTTALTEWLNTHAAAGILSPDINGLRYFQNITTKELFQMQTTTEVAPVLRVGKYIFYQAAFNHAIEVLKQAAANHSPIIILDEAGPLELRGEGFHLTICDLLMQMPAHAKLVLVVRDELVPCIIAQYLPGETKTINDVEQII